MKTIEPTHKEIMQYLMCGWFGSYENGKCECKSRCQFKECYENAKKFLTRTEYTPEEIRAGQERNAKAMDDIARALDEFNDEEEN